MQLTRQDIVDKLKEILLVADEKNKSIVDKITDESRLSTDLGLTSVGMLYMVIAIEESFGIEFDDVGVDDFQTFGDVVEYVKAKLK